MGALPLTITIKNSVIDSNNRPLHIEAENISIANSQSITNSEHGLNVFVGYLHSKKEIKISDSTFNNNSQAGIKISGGKYALSMINASLSQNNGHGLDVWVGENLTLSAISVNSNGQTGLNILGQSNATFVFKDIAAYYNNGSGLILKNVNYLNSNNLSANGNLFQGLVLESSSNNIFLDSDFSNNKNSAIKLWTASDNLKESSNNSFFGGSASCTEAVNCIYLTDRASYNLFSNFISYSNSTFLSLHAPNSLIGNSSTSHNRLRFPISNSALEIAVIAEENGFAIGNICEGCDSIVESVIGSNAELMRSWEYSSNVTDANSLPISNANITIASNSNLTETRYLKTDQNGHTKNVWLKQYIRKSQGQENISYNISVEAASYTPFTKEISVSSNQYLDVIILTSAQNPDVPPTIVPEGGGGGGGGSGRPKETENVQDIPIEEMPEISDEADLKFYPNKLTLEKNLSQELKLDLGLDKNFTPTIDETELPVNLISVDLTTNTTNLVISTHDIILYVNQSAELDIDGTIIQIFLQH